MLDLISNKEALNKKLALREYAKAAITGLVSADPDLAPDILVEIAFIIAREAVKQEKKC